MKIYRDSEYKESGAGKAKIIEVSENYSFLLEKWLKKNNLNNIKKEFIPEGRITGSFGNHLTIFYYLMYNLCYTELFFTETLWPDFKKKELEKIIKEFKNISRNYGL